MSKHLTPDAWAAQFSEAWRAICEGRAAVMPIDQRNRNPLNNQPVQTKSRNLAFRMDTKPKRKPKGIAP